MRYGWQLQTFLLPLTNNNINAPARVLLTVSSFFPAWRSCCSCARTTACPQHTQHTLASKEALLTSCRMQTRPEPPTDINMFQLSVLKDISSTAAAPYSATGGPAQTDFDSDVELYFRIPGILTVTDCPSTRSLFIYVSQRRRRRPPVSG